VSQLKLINLKARIADKLVKVAIKLYGKPPQAYLKPHWPSNLAFLGGPLNDQHLSDETAVEAACRDFKSRRTPEELLEMYAAASMGLFRANFEPFKPAEHIRNYYELGRKQPLYGVSCGYCGGYDEFHTVRCYTRRAGTE